LARRESGAAEPGAEHRDSNIDGKINILYKIYTHFIFSAPKQI
jgi:hypothetical protein